MEKLKSQETQLEKPSSFRVLGWAIEYSTIPGARSVTIDRDKRRIVVNMEGGFDEVHLRQIGILTAAREEALTESIKGEGPKEALRLFSENKEFVREFLRLTGARLLKERDPKMAQEISDALPPADSAVNEFKIASAMYIITGKFPLTTEVVAKELRKLPVSSKTNEHLLSAFTSARVALSRKLDYFERFIQPALERLRKVDTDMRASESEDFQPSTEDFEKRERNESEIMQRVEPFVGGYFREKVMDGVDWEAMRVVATGVPNEKLLPPEEDRTVSPEAKVHVFKGTNGRELATGELTAPLPASARVFPETASAGLAIRMSANGVHTLEWVGEGEPPETYEFQFERTQEPPDWQKAEPTEAEQGIPSWVIETFSADTKSFLEGLKNARLTDAARVRQIAYRVQKNIEYVNDTSVGNALAAAGKQYFVKLEEIKKGDCDVSNFYSLAQIRALDIPCRMIIGFHIQRDKRFTFAALAGTKHAWLEWWNKDSGLWERIDATPPRKEKELRRISKTEKLKIEPDESDDDPFGLPFEEENLKFLKKQLPELPETIDETAATGQIFEDLYGISLERWNAVRSFAESVGRERLPREATIDKRSDSTVAEEWKRIFDLFLDAYRLPSPWRRVIGKESQGGELVDPVSAGIDILIGNEDPYGYEKKERREQTEKLPIRFSNDFLLDVTASMEAQNREGQTLLELERKFVMSSLYEGYKLNERLKQRAVELFTTPLITHHILSIHGGARWREILKNAPVELKELAAIDEAMKKPTKGSGAMAEAIEQYVKTLEEDAATISALKNGEMVKTLTILTDGNLWCSSCGKESCDYELHGPTLSRVNKALEKARQLGVIVNVIGFTEYSRPVTELFAVEGDSEAAVVVETLGEALAAHHRQTIRALQPVIKTAQKRKRIGKNLL